MHLPGRRQPVHHLRGPVRLVVVWLVWFDWLVCLGGGGRSFHFHSHSQRALAVYCRVQMRACVRFFSQPLIRSDQLPLFFHAHTQAAAVPDVPLVAPHHAVAGGVAQRVSSSPVAVAVAAGTPSPPGVIHSTPPSIIDRWCSSSSPTPTPTPHKSTKQSIAQQQVRRPRRRALGSALERDRRRVRGDRAPRGARGGVQRDPAELAHADGVQPRAAHQPQGVIRA